MIKLKNKAETIEPTRGVLTKKIQEISKQHIGREIDTTELRLIPYLQYVMCNEQKLDPRRINQEERVILSMIKDDGHIQGGATGLAVTKEYWDYMCEVLFEAYVKGGAYEHNKKIWKNYKHGDGV